MKTLDGSSRLHSFVDIGRQRPFRVRERSCHKREGCLQGKAPSQFGHECESKHLCLQIKDVVLREKPTPGATRERRSAANIELDAMLDKVSVGMVVCCCPSSCWSGTGH
eukprot:6213717-Pleurochrysis_carterae.AAC.5